MGLFIQVDEGKATSVPNVFACGDAARAAGNMTVAVGAGRWRGLGRIGGRWFEDTPVGTAPFISFQNINDQLFTAALPDYLERLPLIMVNSKCVMRHALCGKASFQISDTALSTSK